MAQFANSSNNENSKVVSLREAIERFVKPGTTLHMAGGIGGPSAAICEVIRQFRGKHPDFTIVTSTLTGHGLNLVYCGLVKKLVCAVCMELSTSGRPSKIIQKAYADKTIDLENWSLCSLQQRLMAGAFGFSFMPTRSVIGSSIAADKTGFGEIDDPFGAGGKVGIIQALNPDVSIVHGCVADAEGNVVLSAPYGEDFWGSLAAKNVIVTVEKIVPTAFIRKYAALVKIPSYMVSAVCVTPMGLHPFSVPNPGIDDFEPYEKDVDFLVEFSKASKGGTVDAWIDEWIDGCADHQAYLAKLGEKRLDTLKDRSKTTIGTPVPPDITDDGEASPGDYDPKQMMLIALGREVLRSVREQGHNLILAGAGAGSTAAFMAYYRLKPEGYDIELLTGNGQVGYTPVPGESILASEAGVRTCKMLSDTTLTQGVLVGGKNNKCLSVLGAGQMDRYGNLNSTVTASGQFLVGSGGANDALNAREVIVALDQSRERFAESLPYITGPGAGVTTVVSTMGIFRKPAPGEELQLVACFSDGGATTLEEKIEKIRQNCGWPLKVDPAVKETTGPTRGELRLLQWLVSPPS
jgi:acyl CoA:acetate/3-ketoacid CoA transferase alpha subunit/acyl CoA:acetate/3-ketoacid CoA transferase beta subunit